MNTLVPNLKDVKIAVIGLGYVGTPLAAEFAKTFSVVGYDIDADRVSELAAGRDRTGECSAEDLISAVNLSFTSQLVSITDCNVFIVTVPTPVDKENRPNLNALVQASRAIASLIKPGDAIIYESTVFPGATEEICVPILSEISGLRLNIDFSVGYSPERINPGDNSRTLPEIVKVTSASNSKAADFVASLYEEIITAGIHRAPSIKVAEAAKVIENTQRDLNIALMNELSMIFDRLNISTTDVLAAAKTKWNFLPFEPGLVGGHCISVDPYYLTHKAQSLGYLPEVILSGRRINEQMSEYIVNRFIRSCLTKKLLGVSKRVLIMGLTFKEDCPDLRNSKVLDILDSLIDASFDVDIFDPYINSCLVPDGFQGNFVSELQRNHYVGVIVAVKHSSFLKLKFGDVKACCVSDGVIFDLKSIFDGELVDFQL